MGIWQCLCHRHKNNRKKWNSIPFRNFAAQNLPFWISHFQIPRMKRRKNLRERPEEKKSPKYFHKSFGDRQHEFDKWQQFPMHHSKSYTLKIRNDEKMMIQQCEKSAALWQRIFEMTERKKNTISSKEKSRADEEKKGHVNLKIYILMSAYICDTFDLEMMSTISVFQSRLISRISCVSISISMQFSVVFMGLFDWIFHPSNELQYRT